MLKEEQVAELLRRCEAIAGRELKQTRGNLRKAETRAAAVWELIASEAASQLGRVELEPPAGGPDIRLELPTGRWASIEVTYLHPRFEGEERRKSHLVTWVHEALSALVPNQVLLRCEFHGVYGHPAGPKLDLPQEQDRKRFLASAEVAQFLSAVTGRPQEPHQIRLSEFPVTLMSSPRPPGDPGFLTWGGPCLEAPKVVSEHAAHRALRAKVRQHSVNGPHLVCIGSDVSRVLSSPANGMGIRLEDALGAAVRKGGGLSGVLVVNIEDARPVWSAASRTARSTAYPVADCRYPLTDEEWTFIRNLDFNRWKFTPPLPRKEVEPRHRYRHLDGPLTLGSSTGAKMKLTIPAYVLTDVLAGRKNLSDEYGAAGAQLGGAVLSCLAKGWSVVGCEFCDGDIQQGKAPMVVLELAPPHEALFWPRAKEDQRSN